MSVDPQANPVVIDKLIVCCERLFKGKQLGPRRTAPSHMSVVTLPRKVLHDDLWIQRRRPSLTRLHWEDHDDDRWEELDQAGTSGIEEVRNQLRGNSCVIDIPLHQFVEAQVGHAENFAYGR